MKIIYFIPVGITVTVQYLILPLVDVINVEVILVPRVPEKI